MNEILQPNFWIDQYSKLNDWSIAYLLEGLGLNFSKCHITQKHKNDLKGVFLDGNKDNFLPSNLVMVSHKIWEVPSNKVHRLLEHSIYDIKYYTYTNESINARNTLQHRVLTENLAKSPYEKELQSGSLNHILNALLLSDIKGITRLKYENLEFNLEEWSAKLLLLKPS
jgi:hypothetical protein